MPRPAEAGALLLRRARAGDAVNIARLHADSWREVYRGLLADPYLDDECGLERLAHWTARLAAPGARQRLDVAVRHQATVGFCCVHGAHDPTWGHYINNLHVVPAMQGQGIGTALLLQAARHCLCDFGDASAFLWVAASNVAAQRFYRRLGAAPGGDTDWAAPGGTTVRLRRYVWPSVRSLAEAA